MQKYYCKINDKNFGPMNLERLKNLVINKQLKSSDKVSLTFPITNWVEASSLAELVDVFKAQANECYVPAFTESTNNSATGFSQEVNIELLEKNLIKIVNLLIFVSVLVSVLVTLIVYFTVFMIDVYDNKVNRIISEIDSINKKLPPPPKLGWKTFEFESKKGNVNPD